MSTLRARIAGLASPAELEEEIQHTRNRIRKGSPSEQEAFNDGLFAAAMDIDHYAQASRNEALRKALPAILGQLEVAVDEAHPCGLPDIVPLIIEGHRLMTESA